MHPADPLRPANYPLSAMSDFEAHPIWINQNDYVDGPWSAFIEELHGAIMRTQRLFGISNSRAFGAVLRFMYGRITRRSGYIDTIPESEVERLHTMVKKWADSQDPPLRADEMLVPLIGLLAICLDHVAATEARILKGEEYDPTPNPD